MNLEHPLIGMIIRKCVVFNFANKDIIFIGYPAILALEVMEMQTQLPSALDLPRVKVGVPHTDFKHHINEYIRSTWQDDWSGVVANKLHFVKPVLGDWQSFYKRCRTRTLSCLVSVSVTLI